MSRFDKLASQWDLNPRRVESARKTTQKLKKLLEIKDRDILDFGSGTGLISFDLFEEASSVTAMDSSPGMLDEMNRKIEEAGISNITTKLFDANVDSFEKEQYDLVVTAMTLHHITNPAAFIQNAAISLKPGGYLAISDLESEDGTFHSHGNEDVAHFGFDKEKIQKWYAEAGLEMVYLETNEIINKHRDFHIFLAVGKRV